MKKRYDQVIMCTTEFFGGTNNVLREKVNDVVRHIASMPKLLRALKIYLSV